MIHPDYKSGKTLHEQIEDEIKRLIVSGAWQADEQLPSVRELSVQLTVNPNTVQRAYKQLEQDGFIYSIKGKGNFVAAVSHEDGKKRRIELQTAVREAVKELCFLGEEEQVLFDLIHSIYEEKEGTK
ncbi:MAG: GntR family transcriptional regulator [Oscillospiraceae bacterium]|nr:GntR family transcriptional regulator [Oscillospiraceae bacterium]